MNQNHSTPNLQSLTSGHVVIATFFIASFLVASIPTSATHAQNKKGFSKTYRGVNSVPSTGPRKHGHVGAQSSKYRPSTNFGSNGINTNQRGNSNRSGRGGYGNAHRNHSSHAGHNHQIPNRSYGNVYNGGLVNRFGSSIGFSSGYGVPGYGNYGYTAPYGSTYRYGGLSTGYYQPNYSTYTQPYGYDTYGNPSSLASSITANDLELIRLRLELQRARQRELEFQSRIGPDDRQPVNARQPISAIDQAAINRLNEATVIDAGPAANSTQLRAERAFRDGRYGQAAKFSELANVLSGGDGRLDLFAAQAHFADEKFSEATQALTAASQKLDASQLSYFVDNFRLFYGQNDYVNQTKSLSIHIDRNADDVDALIFRGYQYGALGYPDAANKDLDRVLELRPGHELATKLKMRFGQTAITKPTE